MPKEKLFEAVPGKLLDDGIMPSAEPTVCVWADASNAWFKELHIEHMPGAQRIATSIGREAKAMAQAYVGGKPRVYYEDLGIINYYNLGDSSSVLIDSIASTGAPDFCPYGEWLLVADNVGPLRLWKGAGGFISIATGEFSRAKLVRKLAQHVIAYSTDVYPTGFHWCSASDPETWTPLATNSARSIPIRDLDSEIIAVEPLGPGHGVYSNNTLLVVQYLGPSGGWFGTPSQAVVGIGAASAKAIISLGKFNWGLSRGGIFMTDGTSYMYVDRPAIDGWVRDAIDWNRASEIAGVYDERLVLLKWTVPVQGGGRSVICLDPRAKSALNRVWPGYQDSGQRAFSFSDNTFSAGLPRNVFNNPLIAKSDGIYLDSARNTLAEEMTLRLGLISAGAHDYYKSWDYGHFQGVVAGAEIRFGFTNEPSFGNVDWTAWESMSANIPFGPRESVYMTLEIKTKLAFKLAGVTIYGEPGAPAT